MYLKRLSAVSRQDRLLTALFSVSLAFWLILSAVAGPLASAQSAPVSYSTGSNIRSDGMVDITLSVHTDVEIAGVSVHIGFQNGDFAGFQAAQTTLLQYVYYYENYDDIVAICNNNSCAPGTYQIATITVAAIQTGNVTVSFNPKETARPDLSLIQATGTSDSYNLTATAPPGSSGNSGNNTSPKPNTYIIPNDDGDGGILPLQVTNDKFIEQTDSAQNIFETTSTTGKSDTALRNMIVLGLAIGLGFALFTFILFRFFGKGPKIPPGPSGPMIPPTPGGPGTAIVG